MRGTVPADCATSDPQHRAQSYMYGAERTIRDQYIVDVMVLTGHHTSICLSPSALPMPLTKSLLG